jgi:hypothetical protein
VRFCGNGGNVLAAEHTLDGAVMPKRTNDFQSLIYFLETQLAPTGATVQESALVTPLDGGAPVEIDILIEASIGHHRIRVAVECRDHSRPSTVEWINELFGRYAVLPVDHVVAVSRKGFTMGARTRAEGSKIHLFTLEEAREEDWPSVFRGWRLAFVQVTPRLTQVQITYKGDEQSFPEPAVPTTPIVNGADSTKSTILDDVQMLYRSQVPKLLRDWWPTQTAELLKENGPKEREVVFFFNAIDRFIATPDGRQLAIDAIYLTVACSFSVDHAEPQFYKYNGTHLTEFSDTTTAVKFSLILDPSTGAPTAVNIRKTK